jgi:DNA polymerase-3 subunit delta'
VSPVDGTDTSQPTTDPFAAVVGQPGPVALLRAAAAKPVHAYLLVGATGWGTRAAARAFAGELLAGAGPPEETARHRHLATTERHPAITVVERVGASISAEQARDIVRKAALSPPEGTRQVIVLVDFHLIGPQAPILLKSIEEPPPGTFFVVLAEDVPPELETIASRCVRIDFGPIPTADLVAALVSEGVDPHLAEAAAAGGAGDLDRARLLASDPNLEARRAFWWSLPSQLDGTGATIAELVGAISAHTDEVLAPLAVQQAAEMERATEQVERFGAAKGSLSELEARHKRELRRIRTDELRAGLATLAARYRDDVRHHGGRAAFTEAGSLIGQVCDRLVYNPNERLVLEALLVDLPPLTPGPD